MKTSITHAYVLTEITSTLADVLGVEAEDISPSSEMVNDLGAESLDFVEFNANLEKKFNLSLPKKGALFQAGKISGNLEQFYGVKTGLTPDGIDLLSHSLSRYSHLQPGMMIGDIFNATQVINIADLCYNLLTRYLPPTCPECGHSHAKLSPLGKLQCESCSVLIRPLQGDEAEEKGLRSYLDANVLEVA